MIDFLQASSSLPKTSYFKMVDVWLLSSILIIFTIIVAHTIIDWMLESEKKEKQGLADLQKTNLINKVSTVHPTNDAVTNNQDISDQSNKKAVKKKYFSSKWMILLARILIVVAIVVFNILYWTVVIKGYKTYPIAYPEDWYAALKKHGLWSSPGFWVLNY